MSPLDSAITFQKGEALQSLSRTLGTYCTSAAAMSLLCNGMFLFSFPSTGMPTGRPGFFAGLVPVMTRLYFALSNLS